MSNQRRSGAVSAAAPSFVLDGDDEEAALNRWVIHIRATAQKSAPELAGHGLEMHPWSNWVWLQVRNDSVQGLESAIQALEGNIHAQRNSQGQFVEEIAANVKGSRDEVRKAAERFVHRVDELLALEVR